MKKRTDLAERNKTHGLSKVNPRLYRIWKGMKSRCGIYSATGYAKYGGRGISVCEQWHDFSNFYNWAIKNGYKDNLTIERLDVDGHYDPDNCSWISLSDQQQNKTNSHKIDFNGELLTLAQLSKRFNVNKGTLLSRYQKGDRGDSLVRPVVIQGKSSKLNKEQISEIKKAFSNGESVNELINNYDVKKSTLYKIKKVIFAEELKKS